MARTDNLSPILSADEVESLILENRGWAESIARSVARAWNMDWQLDGLDGAAMEALIFCARRFDPARGVPFRGYARKRIHEASTEEARKSRSWKTGVGLSSRRSIKAREISAQLFDIFPNLRSGILPADGGRRTEQLRSAVRSLLIGASILAVKDEFGGERPDQILELKKMVELIAVLEPVHQAILWKTYWEGSSLRQVAKDWETDELNVMREHRALITYLHKRMTRTRKVDKPRVRPGLRKIALKLKRKSDLGKFSEMLKELDS